jgi:dGTPase
MKMMINFYVIADERLNFQQAAHRRVIEDLFEMYVRDISLLPELRREQIADHEDPIRATADHIASMTEADALWTYRRLSGQDAGTFTDVVPY